MSGVKLLLKENPEKLDETHKKDGDWIRTVNYMDAGPGKFTGLLEHEDHSAVTVGWVYAFTQLLHYCIIDLIDSSERKVVCLF